MSLAIVHSRAISGLRAIPIQVEADLQNGLPNFSVVGLPDAAVREARERVRAAMINSGFEFPQRRVTVNLAPADLPKDSGRFDLPIAIGILAASGQIRSKDLHRQLSVLEFVGELSMTGSLLPVRGAFALAVGMQETIAEKNNSLRPDTESRTLILPMANRAEASLTESDRIRFADCLRSVVEALTKDGEGLAPPIEIVGPDQAQHRADTDWSEIKGQEIAKRAAVIAVTGRHNLLMFGPPGVGKSMIASRMPGLMPLLSKDHACEVAAIQSLDKGLDIAGWRRPPFRSPHHSTPARAIIGGGQPVRPGEISLAHRGLLFLDELPEFSREALEGLREPLETGEVSVARVRERLKFPADVMLVAAMNPCPCGYFGTMHARRVCKCPPDRIERYRLRISGPLMDRFDMAVGLQTVPEHQLIRLNQADSAHDAPAESLKLAAQVSMAREIQIDRQGCHNSRLSVMDLEKFARPDAQSERLLQQVSGKWGWSVRSWHRVLRVSRTIADLAASKQIGHDHVSEAIELRRAMDVV